MVSRVSLSGEVANASIAIREAMFTAIGSSRRET
jgi:hypothetical protein